MTVGGPVSGGYGLTTAGAGTVVLTGNNSYSNGTTISTGTLQIGNGGSTGSLGTGSVTNNATVAFNLAGANTISNSLSGGGTFVNLGTGAVTLNNGSISGTVNGGAAGIVLANNLSNGIGVQGVVTANMSNTGQVVSSGAPGTILNVTTGMSTWWVGATTAANAMSLNISAGATVSDNSGQGGAPCTSTTWPAAAT